MRAAALLSLGLLGACAALCAEESAPAFPVPVRPLGFDLAAPLPPVAVTGMNVIAPDGKPITPPLQLREDGLYSLRVAVKNTENAVREPLTLSAALDSGGPVRAATAAIPDSPEAAPAQILTLPLRLEPAQGSGESVLRISAARTGDGHAGIVQSWPLAVFPAFVIPVAAPSTLDAGRVAAFYGSKSVLLNARFRLGKGASVEVRVPPALSGVSISAVGIVSSVAWLPRQDRNRSGLVLATVKAAAPSGQETFPLRLGVETLQVDHEAFAKNRALDTDRVRVFSEWSQGSDEKSPVRRNYAATFPLELPHGLRSITVKHVGVAAVVQVDGIVLLPAE
jgi:hypothetical protein